jgi:hypothetical protein
MQRLSILLSDPRILLGKNTPRSGGLTAIPSNRRKATNGAAMSERKPHPRDVNGGATL